MPFQCNNPSCLHIFHDNPIICPDCESHEFTPLDNVQVEHSFQQNLKLAGCGDADAIEKVVSAYIHGCGVEKDYKEAVYWAKRGSKQNIAYCWEVLGRAYQMSRGDMEPDIQKALECYQKAVDNGLKRSSYYIARIMEHGNQNIQKDKKKAYSMMKDAAETKFKPAVIRFGYYCESGIGCHRDYQKAVQCYRKYIKTDAFACTRLGMLYVRGKGVKKSMEEAVHLYQQAAEKGYQEAQYLLGMAYLNGDVPNMDIEDGITWLKKADQNGELRATTQLGIAYEVGTRVEPNMKAAMNYYRKAFLAGNTDAAYRLGLIHKKDVTTHQKAADYFAVGAEKDDANCICGLADMIVEENNSPENMDKAKAYYKRAAALGCAAAKQAISAINAAEAAQQTEDPVPSPACG